MAVLGASLSLPFILGSLLQGLIVDRWSPKWLSVIGYLLLTAAVPLAWFATSLMGLYASALVVGAAFATIEPSRSALTGLLVDGPGLVKANGTISIAFQLSLVVGTLGSGYLLEISSADAVYAISAGLAALAIPLVLAIPDVRQRGEQPAMSLEDLRTGARTAWHHPRLRILLLVTGLGWTLINVFLILEPLFVQHTLHREGNALLYLWAAHGIGALSGALWMAHSKRATGREASMVCLGVAVVGAGVVVYTGVGIYLVALGAAALAGSGFGLFFPPLLAYIQRVVPEDQTGRVTSMFVATQESMGLLSSLVLLILGVHVAVRPTIVVCGALLVLIGAIGLRALRGLQEPSEDDRTPA